MRKAFTLIELLVVIAIIAILAAILFPVFAQSKAAAKQNQNLSNLKNLGTATLIYMSDSDDFFPLVQREEPTSTAFFGLAPWQVACQPYIKSLGIFQHPLGPNVPANDAALAAWRYATMYGSMARANGQGLNFYEASTSVGSFARRVCGNTPCRYDGIMGRGCNPAVTGCGWYGGGNGAVVPSLSATAISNSADQLMLSEGGFWDLFSLLAPGNPCTYIVTWSPAQYNANGSGGVMSCPGARRNPKPQAPDGACSPANLCDGFFNVGIQNGLTTYVASDGHAISRDYRGGLMKWTILPDGTKVINAMWPAGGF